MTRESGCLAALATGVCQAFLQPDCLLDLGLCLSLVGQVLGRGLGLLLELLLLRLLLELLLLWLLLELLLLGLLLELLLPSRLAPPGVKVVGATGRLALLELLLRLELRSLLLELLRLLWLLLELLLLLRLLELLLLLCLLELELLLLLWLLLLELVGAEPVTLLAARLFKLSLCLLLLPLPLLLGLLLPPGLGLLRRPGLLLGRPLPSLLRRDHLVQCLQVQGEEHLESVGLPVLRQGGELGLGVLLQVAPQREELLVEGRLLVPAQSLPGGGVSEWLQTQLLVLQLLSDGLPLAGRQDQLVGVAQVDVSQVGDERLPGLSGEPGGRGCLITTRC